MVAVKGSVGRDTHMDDELGCPDDSDRALIHTKTSEPHYTERLAWFLGATRAARPQRQLAGVVKQALHDAATSTTLAGPAGQASGATTPTWVREDTWTWRSASSLSPDIMVLRPDTPDPGSRETLLMCLEVKSMRANTNWC